jgi:hypothetical protein
MFWIGVISLVGGFLAYNYKEKISDFLEKILS